MIKTIKYEFKNQELLSLALTQSGANASKNNERLEFLGDRVLGLSVADMLYSMFPSESEGALAQRHAMLVSSDTLARIAKNLGIAKQVRHGHMTAGKVNHLMADAMESILGAIYLDGGFDAVRDVILDIWQPIAQLDIIPPKDAKTSLQELVQKQDGGALPEYIYLDSDGPSHSPVFKVSVSALGRTATGTGASKKMASTDAAVKLLEILSSDDKVGK